MDFILTSLDTALSPDSKLLAISSSHPRVGILIYDVATKELRQALEGCGTLAFRPLARQHQQDAEGKRATDISGEIPAYTLVSSFSSGEPRFQPHTGLILWELDSNGRLFVEEEPIDPAAIAIKAIDAILPELEAEHEWTRAFVDASNLHADFVRALENASADHRRRNNTVVQNAVISSFVSTPFSSDGALLLYAINNKSTQHGMREPNALPQVVVYDVDVGREVHRLRGHSDQVTWLGSSPDDQHVASVSWDGTLRMYSTEKGELEWATADSGGQSWAGAFSPDSKHIVWSSHSGKEIGVHKVADGEVLSTFPESVTRWCRCFSWHPTKQQMALCADKTVYVWQPFDGPGGVVVQRWVMDDDGQFPRMAQIQNVSWLGDGRLLSLTTSDRTVLVYDTLTNAKEVFKRPKGADAAYVRTGFYALAKDEERTTYLSIDGDGKVRYWDRSVAPLPDTQSERESAVERSWWENRAEDPKASTRKGEYAAVVSTIKEQVMGAKSGEGSATAGDEEREAWAQKGTGIWTAE
ncbi:uncharacterized protein N0V89_008661 [Didymosphaeria variabile]|uniref:WD40 repeat-like protein n=1 Tax=Didymosphaeria variabile TaxID=1932322 RepID=A0A9W8XGC8_9PLEO|nr:uncharacterized protein N0V89_008661 [Didymosphaeria variabile]KAJ4350040.1 hypothetical protein N0V89_008661 [Didymosphaeria variabile]